MLGPLVVAGAAIEEERENLLWDRGARDSKTLSRARRRLILGALVEAGLRGWVILISPSDIDRGNLTELELRAMAEIIRRFRPKKVVVDPPVGPKALTSFCASLAQAASFPEPMIHSVPKADQKQPVVAAASILAKVVRDGAVEILRSRFGDFGWGYPGEAKVQSFLRQWLSEHQELPEICRRRWRSVRILVNPELQVGL